MRVKIEDDSSKRLDIAVKDILTAEGFSLTRSLIQEHVHELASVNSQKEKKSYRLKKGDVLDIEIDNWKKLEKSIELSEDIVGQEGVLDIRYEDEDLLVLFKPKGLVVHPGVGNPGGTLANYVRYYLESKGEYDTLMDRSGIVHRLDKGVSGLMVVAKKKKVQDFLKSQFQDHSVIKIYRASVERIGKCNDPDLLKYILSRDIEDVLRALDIDKQEWLKWYLAEGYIARSNRNRYKMEFKRYQWNNAKFAKSYVLPFENEVLVKIETGRMHQIRATLEFLGLRILGDQLYGTPSSVNGSESIALESIILSFTKPSGERLVITANEKK